MAKDLMKQVINLEDIEPVEMPKGFLTRLLAVVDNFSVTVIESTPGTRFEAVHPEAELVYVLRGQIEYDDGRIVKAKEAVVNLPDVPHSGITAGNEPILFIEIKSPPPKVYLDLMESRS